MTISPSVMSSRPTIIRRRVDFPHPEGPTRIMNSPSCTSMLTSFTALNPSPYVLTMFFMSMAAIESPLYSAGRQPGDDLSLEQQDDDDDRDGDHHGGGGQLSVRRVERVRPDEVGQLRRDRAGRCRGRQRERKYELVPGEEEGQDGRREDTRRRERNDHLAERLPRGGAV